MDAQILQVVAQLSPEQRVAFAQAQGVPPQVLMQLERAAVESGLELNGGSVFEQMGEGDEGEGSGAGGAVPLPSFLGMVRDKAWSLGTSAAFWLAIPVLLYVIKERRGMSWRQLAEGLARLPFSD